MSIVPLFNMLQTLPIHDTGTYPDNTTYGWRTGRLDQRSPQGDHVTRLYSLFDIQRLPVLRPPEESHITTNSYYSNPRVSQRKRMDVEKRDKLPLLGNPRAKAAWELPEAEQYIPPDVDMPDQTGTNLPRINMESEHFVLPTVDLVRRKRMWGPSTTRLPPAKRHVTDENRAAGTPLDETALEWRERVNPWQHDHGHGSTSRRPDWFTVEHMWRGESKEINSPIQSLYRDSNAVFSLESLAELSKKGM